jgi:hypothetical protein
VHGRRGPTRQLPVPGGEPGHCLGVGRPSRVRRDCRPSRRGGRECVLSTAPPRWRDGIEPSPQVSRLAPRGRATLVWQGMGTSLPHQGRTGRPPLQPTRSPVGMTFKLVPPRWPRLDPTQPRWVSKSRGAVTCRSISLPTMCACEPPRRGDANRSGALRHRLLGNNGMVCVLIGRRGPATCSHACGPTRRRGVADA